MTKIEPKKTKIEIRCLVLPAYVTRRVPRYSTPVYWDNRIVKSITIGTLLSVSETFHDGYKIVEVDHITSPGKPYV